MKRSKNRSKPAKVSLRGALSLLLSVCLSVSLLSIHAVERNDSIKYQQQNRAKRVVDRGSSIKPPLVPIPVQPLHVPVVDTSAFNVNQNLGTHHKLDSTASFVIFYNAFISPKSPGRGVAIIQEQMLQIYNSPSHRYTPIYYNLIGLNYTESPLCPRADMKCHQLKYMEQGNEEDTLQDLYEYCVSHPTEHVIYLHDKGSLHPTANNHKVRKMATTAALSNACRSVADLRDSSDDDTCSVCATKYQFLPHGHAPGNHWTANCRYIRTLIPPRDFEAKRRQMYVDLLDSSLTEKTETVMHEKTFPCLDAALQLKASFDIEDGKYDGENHQLLGIGRYAMETWVWSSPWVVPCHVVDSAFHRFESGLEVLSDHEKAAPGPGEIRFAFMGAHKLDWFHAKGKLFEYQYLYPEQRLVNGTNFLIRKLQSMPQGQKAEC
jgi:hypothetical protein